MNSITISRQKHCLNCTRDWLREEFPKKLYNRFRSVMESYGDMSKIKKGRVLMIGLNLPPDFGGMRSWHIAKALVSQGYEVCAVTNFPNQPYGKISRKYRWKLMALEEMEGIKMIRVLTLPLPYSGIFSRLLIFSFFSLASLFSLSVVGEIDFVYSRGPHPFTEFPAFIVKRIKHSSLIVDITDAWPESLALVKINKVLLKLFFGIGKIANRMMYALSDSVITHTQSLKTVISVYTDKQISILPGVVDTASFHPTSKNEAYLKLSDARNFSFAVNKFVFLYTGTIGPVQNLETIIDLAEKTKQLDDIIFMLVGGGEERDKLEKEVVRRGLTNIFFVGLQPPQRMPFIINLADVCILPLMSSPLLRTAIPKKFFEYAACGKPVLCISPRGEASNLITRWKAGVSVNPDNSEDIKVLVTTLKAKTKCLKTMGENARRMAENLFSLTYAGKYLDEIFENVKTRRDECYHVLREVSN